MASRVLTLPVGAAVDKASIGGAFNLIAVLSTDVPLYISFAGMTDEIDLRERGNKIIGCRKWGEAYYTVRAADAVAGAVARVLVSDELNVDLGKASGVAGGVDGSVTPIVLLAPGDYNAASPTLRRLLDAGMTALLPGFTGVGGVAQTVFHATRGRYGVHHNGGTQGALLFTGGAETVIGCMDIFQPGTHPSRLDDFGFYELSNEVYAHQDLPGLTSWFFFGFGRPDAGAGDPRGFGFVAHPAAGAAHMELRAYYRRYDTGALVFSVPLGKSTADAYRTLRLQCGVDSRGDALARWIVDGETLHEFSGPFAAVDVGTATHRPGLAVAHRDSSPGVGSVTLVTTRGLHYKHVQGAL